MVTWGPAQRAGISRGDMCKVRAILGDGSVVSWGDAGSGGDNIPVREQLHEVPQIMASADGGWRQPYRTGAAEACATKLHVVQLLLC